MLLLGIVFYCNVHWRNLSSHLQDLHKPFLPTYSIGVAPEIGMEPTFGVIAMTCCADTHDPQRMNLYDFPASTIITKFSKTALYDTSKTNVWIPISLNCTLCLFQNVYMLAYSYASI